MILYEIEMLLKQVQFRDWEFQVSMVRPAGLSLRVRAPHGICNVYGTTLAWNGRWWLLSVFATRSEVIQTALKAVLTAVEHEAREQFTYRGKAIFGPHFNVDALADLCKRGPGAEDKRPERPQAPDAPAAAAAAAKPTVPTCTGSYACGTACGKCFKCAKERAMLYHSQKGNGGGLWPDNPRVRPGLD